MVQQMRMDLLLMVIQHLLDFIILILIKDALVLLDFTAQIKQQRFFHNAQVLKLLPTQIVAQVLLRKDNLLQMVLLMDIQI
jgi:hypothetical protein